MKVSNRFRKSIEKDFGPFELLWETMMDDHHIVWIKTFWEDKDVGLLFCETCHFKTNSRDCPYQFAARGLRRAQLRLEMQNKYWRGRDLDIDAAIEELRDRGAQFEFLGQHNTYSLDAIDLFDIFRRADCEGYDEPGLDDIEDAIARQVPPVHPDGPPAMEITIGTGA